MKLNVEVDATPEEVRRLLGLPDVSEVHAVYIDRLKKVADKGVTPDLVQQMVRGWMPGGSGGVDLMKDLLGAFTAGSSKATKKDGG